MLCQVEQIYGPYNKMVWPVHSALHLLQFSHWMSKIVVSEIIILSFFLQQIQQRKNEIKYISNQKRQEKRRSPLLPTLTFKSSNNTQQFLQQLFDTTLDFDCQNWSHICWYTKLQTDDTCQCEDELHELNKNRGKVSIRGWWTIEFMPTFCKLLLSAELGADTSQRLQECCVRHGIINALDWIYCLMTAVMPMACCLCSSSVMLVHF